MKRYLLLGAIALAGTILVLAGLVAGWFFIQPLAEAGAPMTPMAPVVDTPKETRSLEPLPDVDALARRLPYNQAVYKQLRDEALVDYAKVHAGANPSDAEAQGTLKLLAYLCVWDDFYGEGLWSNAVDHANHLISVGQQDQIWSSLADIDWYSDRHSVNDDDVDRLSAQSTRLDGEAWPAVFRLRACETALKNMVSSKTDSSIQPPLGSSLQALPDMVDRAVACFRELVREHVTHAFLYRVGDLMLHDAQDDEPTLIQLSKGFDAAFAAEDRDNLQADVLDGDFYVEDAWNARGSGYANTVSAEGWRLFAERLQSAERILTDVYSRAPQEPGVAKTMMTVVLGEQQPRDQMEMWFQRGQNVDGNLFNLYMAKRWYLLPRWYGSDEDVWNFGLECSKSTNWPAKIPIMLAECIRDRAENDPNLYAQDAIWQPLEQVYRAYLDHYPASSYYRSLFALSAAQGGHWDVAKEQFKILGKNWDRAIFPDSLHADTMRQVNAH